jgi:hypothetical protein
VVCLRCRDPDARGERWRVCYGDVQIGRIGICASAPVDANQWAWTSGFYPNRGRLGHSAVFDLFNAPAALRGYLVLAVAKVTEADFEEYRRQRDRSDLETCHLETCCRMPTQFSDGFALLLRR